MELRAKFQKFSQEVHTIRPLIINNSTRGLVPHNIQNTKSYIAKVKISLLNMEKSYIDDFVSFVEYFRFYFFQ